MLEKIYTSEKILPYVYQCTHKQTKEFYIGYRAKNKKPSHLDLPLYKTSSKIIKHNFHDYDWFIIAEFFDKQSAFNFEQSLIEENISNPLNLNGFVNGKFSMLDRKHSTKTIEQMKSNRKGIKKSEQTKQKMRVKHSLEIVTCPHCNTQGSGPNMTRYHFNNCEFLLFNFFITKLFYELAIN